MKGAEQEFCLSEEWQYDASALGVHQPQSVHLGRFLGGSDRDVIQKYDLTHAVLIFDSGEIILISFFLIKILTVI